LPDCPNNYNFRRWTDNQKTDPNKIEHELFRQHLRNAVAGKDINFPYLDYDNRKRGPDELIKSNQIILAEGEYTLYFEKVRNLADLKIYVDTDDDLRLVRHIQRSKMYKELTGQYYNPRDGWDMGNIVKIIDWWLERYKFNLKNFISPTKKYADLVITNNGSENELEKSAKQVIDLVNLYFKDEEKFKKQRGLWESRIEELRKRIAKLEKKVNRTVQEEQELKDKKQELAELEGQQQTGSKPNDPKKPTNYWIWIIGGIVILIILVVVAWFFLKNKEGKNGQ
jgi:uridine kinase